MPERRIDEAIEHLDEGVDEIARLVKEVRGLKRWRIFSIGFILVFGLLAGLYGWVLHRQEQDRIDGCRGRNETFSNLFDFIELVADSPEGIEFVDGMRAAAIADCDRDGETVDDLVSRS